MAHHPPRSMSKHGTIKRYALILEKVRRRQYPSFEDIRDFLADHDLEVSRRTIQRDIEQIRYEFGVEVLYDRHRNGYAIDLENSVDIPSFMRFLEIVNTAQLLTDSLRESKESLEHLMFESDGEFRGSGHLRPLLGAIRDRRRVAFDYTKFTARPSSTHYQVEPYLLKEYQNRWYLVGISVRVGAFRIFGLDRMVGLKVLDETFERVPGTDPRQLFGHTVGLTYNEKGPERVVLSFTPLQGKYIQSLPLHHSQEVLKDTDRELRICLFVVPNFEFKQKILMHGATVKVLEPAWLAAEIRDTLQAAARKYK
jgi:predicted DNA-binding transcriptional regulator YafY